MKFQFIRLCAECGLPILGGEFCIPTVQGRMHRRCATRLMMNRMVVEREIHVQEVIGRVKELIIAEHPERPDGPYFVPVIPGTTQFMCHQIKNDVLTSFRDSANTATPVAQFRTNFKHTNRSGAPHV